MQWGWNALVGAIATLTWLLVVGHYRNSGCIFGFDSGDQPWCLDPLAEPLKVYTLEFLILFGIPGFLFVLLEWVLTRLRR